MAARFVEIPFDRLSPEALRGVIEDFIAREGTDYGPRDVTWEGKVEDVLRQLQRQQAHLVFDPRTETTTILTVHEYRRLVTDSR